eukprot:5229469-Amphidinium_carterae.1
MHTHSGGGERERERESHRYEVRSARQDLSLQLAAVPRRLLAGALACWRSSRRHPAPRTEMHTPALQPEC